MFVGGDLSLIRGESPSLDAVMMEVTHETYMLRLKVFRACQQFHAREEPLTLANQRAQTLVESTTTLCRTRLLRLDRPQQVARLVLPDPIELVHKVLDEEQRKDDKILTVRQWKAQFGQWK